MFCAPTPTRVLARRSATAASETNGGQTTRSTPSSVSSSGRSASTSSSASARVVFIFQLPATIGVRIRVLSVRELQGSVHPSALVGQSGHAGQGAALKVLEGSATTGRDVGHLVGQAKLLDRGHRLTAADHRRRR